MYIFVAAVTTALVVSFLCSIFESVLLSISPARVENGPQKMSFLILTAGTS